MVTGDIDRLCCSSAINYYVQRRRTAFTGETRMTVISAASNPTPIIGRDGM